MRILLLFLCLSMFSPCVSGETGATKKPAKQMFKDGFWYSAGALAAFTIYSELPEVELLEIIPVEMIFSTMLLGGLIGVVALIQVITGKKYSNKKVWIVEEHPYPGIYL